MAAPQQNALLDTIESTIQGVHSGIPPTLLSRQHVAESVNLTHRGGKPRTRPAFVKRRSVFADDESSTNSTAALFQRAAYYSGYGNNPSAIVALIGGRLFRFTPGVSTVQVQDISPPGAINNPTAPLAWLWQGEEFLIVNNGLDLPMFFDGAGTRRSGGSPARELPSGTVGTYSNGRIVMALPDRQSYIAGDLVYNTGSGTPAYNYRDSILKTNDNINILGGAAFAVPINAGRINAMFSVAVPDTSLGQGPLQVGTRKGVFGVHLPLDATLWTTLQQPTQVVSLPSAGPLSQDVPIVNMDGWYRAKDGIRSYQIGRRDMGTWVQTSLSSEVNNLLTLDSESLLQHSSSVEFGNRLLMTCSPYRVSERGVAHRGIIALDFHNISSLTTRSNPDYDGLWTGLPILQIIEGEFNGKERCFAFALDADNKICLYEILKDDESDADYDGESDIRIESWLVSNALLGLEIYPERIRVPLKKLLTSDLFIEELSGVIDFDVKFRSDAYPFWNDWKSFTVCATQCEVPTDCSQPACFQRQYATFKRLPDPPDTCNEATGRLHRTGYYFQLRLQWTGHAALDKLLMWASVIDENKNSVCATEECKVLTGALDNFFSYEIEPRCTLAITTEPESQSLSVGEPLSLTVEYTGGTAPVTIQWYKNGTAISGATSATYAVAEVAEGDAGVYYATLTDSSLPVCDVQSASALVSVGSSPAIVWGSTPTPPSCDGGVPYFAVSGYAWGFNVGQNPNELLSAEQLAATMAIFLNERALQLAHTTATGFGDFYWFWNPATAVHLSALHKTGSGNTDPSDPEGNVAVLFNGAYFLAQDVCTTG